MSEVRPYKVIGLRLKKLRERANESLMEASGAVEIDSTLLESIESGLRIPDEDILMLLIKHYNVSDSESVKLWELAGYDRQNQEKTIQAEEQILKQIMMIIPFDNKVVFTDNVNIEANKKGVVINFLLGSSAQPVSSVGMSIESAQELIMKLAEQLQLAKQPKAIRAIPAKTVTKKIDKKNQP